MVDKVSNLKYYDYNKVSQQKRESTGTSEFNLNLGKEGVIYEKGQQKPEKAKEPSLEQEGQGIGASGGAGVKLEISSRGYEKSARHKQGISLIDEVRKYAALAVDFLKSIWDKVWNENPKAKEAEFPEVLEEKMSGQEGFVEETGLSLLDGGKEPDGLQEGLFQRKLSNEIAESIYTQEEIRQIFRRGDQKEIEDFLSNHGKRRLARNTGLLTQYDRKGVIVGINSSDQDLILHGNKNQIKL